MKITPYAYILQVPRENGFLCPTVLYDGKHIILVDACLPNQLDALLSAMAGQGLPPDKLTKVILTHQDMDHIGCVKALKERFPHLQVLAHETEAPYIQGDLPPAKMAAREAQLREAQDEQGLKALRQSMENYKAQTVHVDQLLTDGQELPWCGGMTVIHTPGHTPGHICLVLHEGKVLVTGDAMVIQDGVLSGPSAQHTMDMDMALTSLYKIKPFGVRKAVCYHGGLFSDNFRAALADII